MKNKPEHIFIFDTTLRDGEQSAGASLSVDDKVEIAKSLDEMKVDIIEAGFPYASQGDFDAVKKISKLLKNSIICGLARANDLDIECAYQALRKSKRFRIHTFISTSDLHMKYKLKMSKCDVLESIKRSVSKSRRYTDDVEWSPEDASRTNLSFLYKAIEIAIKSGARTINIPDTVGYALPGDFGKLIKNIKNNVINIDKAIISVHCHNDLGLAVANSLTAITNGARQVECTINGIGERAGNAAMEEIVMCLKTRQDLLPYRSNIITKKISKISHLVSTATGFHIQPNKAIVGKNAFAHESGIHQDGMLKHSNTYEIMTPESIGLSSSELVLGKHSGRHAFKVKLQEHGYKFTKSEIDLLFKKFKNLADKKKQIFEEDLIALVDDQALINKNKIIRFIELDVICGNKKPTQAKIKLIFNEKEILSSSAGEGPIDAIFKSIKKIIKHNAQLTLYQVNAITKGVDAQAEVNVRLEESGFSVQGQGQDIDTMVASAKSYINALNKLIYKREKFESGSIKFLKKDSNINKHVI
ncbi:MAG: 2-isopropylmalate synthase [Rickettsiales bacterium]|nr:2-isopropylmalate synthase [Rickettsiales bacterium]